MSVSSLFLIPAAATDAKIKRLKAKLQIIFLQLINYIKILLPSY